LPHPLLAAAANTVDGDWRSLQELSAQAAPPKTGSEWYSSHGRQVRDLALRFMESYPDDNRKWSAVARFMEAEPSEIEGFRVRSVFDHKVGELMAAVDVGSDVPLAVQELVAQIRFDDCRRMARFAEPNSVEASQRLAVLEQRLERFAARFPESKQLHANADDYLRAVDDLTPSAVTAAEQKLLHSPSAAIASLAKKRMANRQSSAKKVDDYLGRLQREIPDGLAWKFTAVDGRKVDFKELRGKVVLLDFWASWCHNCIEEFPNVRAVYEKYRAQGFEVVGVALEDARLKETDTPEERVEKLLQTKRQFLNGAAIPPWPHYYDGLGFETTIAHKFHVESIPTVVLFDKQGHIVSTEARGPKLEPLVKEYLGR
jgi:thiol-disulfide isomerase/thioredoxin